MKIMTKTRTKRMFAGLLALLMIISAMPMYILAEESDNIIISNEAELQTFAANVNGGNSYEGKTVVLTANINLGGENNPWTPIGTSANSFKGTFDGNYHIISGLYIDSTSNYQGLFGYVSGGTIENVTVQGNVTSMGGYIAGIVGYNNRGVIRNCSSTVDVNGNGGNFVHYYGGVAAYNSGTVTGCVNGGTVTATGGAACGGIVGCNFGGNVVDCYNKGKINNPGSHIGGVVGQNRNSGEVKGSYNVGIVTGKTNVGAVIGQEQSSHENNYYLTDSAANGIGSPVNVDGAMSEDDMKSLDFVGKLGAAFMADENGTNDGYPVLKWETSVSTDEPVSPDFVEGTPLSSTLAQYIREAVNSTKIHKLSSSDKTLLGNQEYMAEASSTDTDWMALAMGRFGVFNKKDGSYSYRIDDGEGYISYLEAMKAYIEKAYEDNNGILHSAKATEWHRAVVTIAALGGDPANFGMYNGQPINLVGDGSYNCSLRNGPGTQGINGWIWGLIALDTGYYEIPSDAKYSRSDFIVEILKMQLTDGVNGNEYGGWVLGGYGSRSDVDITAMAIQALAPYYNDDTVYTYTNDCSGKQVSKTVRQCVDEALECISAMMSGNGGFTSWGTNNVESIAQVVVALCSLGINPAEDTRFITAKGNTLLDGILEFKLSDGGFCHVADGSWNSMANDQAAYALVSYWRLENGMRALYDMRPNWTIDEKTAIETAIGLIDGLPEPSAENYKIRLKEALDAFKEVPKQERRYVGNYSKLAAAIELIGGEDELTTDTPYIISVSVTKKPDKVQYFEGESFDPKGLVVTALYSDGRQETVSELKYSPVGTLTLDNTAVYITYGVLKTSFEITVVEKMPWEGDGTEENPYLIQSADDLVDLYTHIASKNFRTSGMHFKMIEDINMKNIENWRGIADNTQTGFQGHFDGSGHSVWNINNQSNYNVLGLFGSLGDGALIENLTIAGGNLGVSEKYNNIVGGICAKVVSNSTVTIQNCHNYAELNGLWGVGGIVGEVEDNAHVIIENCSNHGKICAAYTGGGIIGQVGPNRWKNNGSSATVTNCYNTGEISGMGSWGLGGIIGSFRLGGTDTSAIKNCYNAGTVQEAKASGAIIGSVCEADLTLENIYYLNASCSQSVGYFDDGGSDKPGTVTGEAEEKTEDEMKADDFADKLGSAFDLDKGSINGGYPTLCEKEKTDEEPPVRAGLEIGTVDELLVFAERVNNGESFAGKTVALTGHLDLSEIDDWIPIGSSGKHSFDGSFDGQNYVIDNLYSVNGGLFGYVGENAVIKNVGVASGEIGREENYIQWLGGIANWSNGADFINCFNGADIYCAGYSGGIVGTIRDGGYSLIKNCYNSGSIYGKDTHVGGIVGHLATSREQEGTEVFVTIEGCYNVGSVFGSNTVGGIAGGIQDGHTIKGCYNAGSIFADFEVMTNTSSKAMSYAGAIAGSSTPVNTFENCYYDVSTCERGIGNQERKEVVGMTAEEMKSQDFVSLLGGIFAEDPYRLANSGYPIFGWQRTYDADDIDEVIEKIEGIGNVTVNRAEAIHEARNAYDNLDDGLKPYVSNYNMLKQAEDVLDSMLALIQAKNMVKNQLETYKNLDDYRSEQQKELQHIIDDGKNAIDMADNIDMVNDLLEEAKSEMDNVKTNHQLINEEAAKKVSELIDQIGEVTLERENAVLAALDAYNILSDEAKALVINFEILVQSEAELKKIKENMNIPSDKDDSTDKNESSGKDDSADKDNSSEKNEASDENNITDNNESLDENNSSGKGDLSDKNAHINNAVSGVSPQTGDTAGMILYLELMTIGLFAIEYLTKVRKKNL